VIAHCERGRVEGPVAARKPCGQNLDRERDVGASRAAYECLVCAQYGRSTDGRFDPEAVVPVSGRIDGHWAERGQIRTKACCLFVFHGVIFAECQ
jgi:hypothetical protein